VDSTDRKALTKGLSSKGHCEVLASRSVARDGLPWSRLDAHIS